LGKTFLERQAGAIFDDLSVQLSIIKSPPSDIGDEDGKPLRGGIVSKCRRDVGLAGALNMDGASGETAVSVA
jgi:hypothetical protein